MQQPQDDDAADVAEAEAAMAEPGLSVPWEQVKADLGLYAEPGEISGDWIHWDGQRLTDDEGHEIPPGRYWIEGTLVHITQDLPE